MVRAADVFVPGGQPTVTYVAREGEGLEQGVKDHLESPYRVLSVTGPTKSGKTVLVRAVLGDTAVLIPGASISSVDELWEQIAYRVGLYASETGSLSHQEGSSSTMSGGLNAGVELSGDVGNSETVTRGRDQTRAVPLHLLVPGALRSKGLVLVIDDFHYIERSLQRDLIRALKPALFDGCAIVLMSVPHRTYDAVRAEPEMTGRVTHLPVPLWTAAELRAIAVAGFAELNCVCEESTLDDFSRQAAGSPHLMQEFCLRLCRTSGVHESAATAQPLGLAAEEREAFYGACANEAASRVEFTLFLRGLQPRSPRKARKLRYGSGEADIYRAVMLALTSVGPKSRLTLDEIRSKLASLLVPGDVPAKHEVTRVLRALDVLARQTTQSEPVLEWDDDEGELHILDPFFGFAARWIGGYVT